MSDTTASLTRKISSAGDLQSVVRTMKALAASSIGQYDNSVRPLGDYYRTVELGLSACFRESTLAAPMTKQKKQVDAGAIGAVVFGSDQGLVGQFNDVVADYAIKTLAALPGKPEVWAVGERVHARLADGGLPPVGLFAVPNSVKAITPLVGQIQIESEAHRAKGEYARVYVFHNRPKSGALYEPVSQRLLPLDAQWLQGLAKVPWPSGNLPEVMGGGTATLRTHPRVSLHLTLPCVRRISREREREPPGGDAACRQEHRRVAGATQGDISSFAPRRHRRGIVRRHRRLRSAFKRRDASGLRMTEAPLSRQAIPIPRPPRNAGTEDNPPPALTDRRSTS